jgi:hypothetical protein
MTEYFFKTPFAWFQPRNGHPLSRRPAARTLFITIIGHCNLAEAPTPLADGTVVGFGQCLTGLGMLAADTGLTVKQVRGQLEWLESEGYIATEKVFDKGIPQGRGPSCVGTVVTVNKFTDYFGSSTSTKKKQGIPHGNILESISSIEEKYIPPTPPPKPAKHSQEDEQLAKAWLDHAVSEKPQLANKLKLAEYADAVRKLRELDGYEAQTLRDLLIFIRADDFWRDKALSPVALRGRSKNGMPKIENVLTAMRRPKAVKRRPEPINANPVKLAELFGRTA